MGSRLVVAALVALSSVACGVNSPTWPFAPELPGFAGRWSGAYRITSCHQSSDPLLPDFCSLQLEDDSSPYSFVLTQDGERVTGTFMLGAVVFSTNGTVGADGNLSLSATTERDPGTVIAVTWNLNLTNDRLNGTVTQSWTITTASFTSSIDMSGPIITAARSS